MTSSPELAARIADELSNYLTDVVICPGSRNSALSLALIARSDIRVHVRIDERSAAFFALGMARVAQRHVGVITTSGTAVANCLPAMIEAEYAHVPLAIISADRPACLRGTGASQTINHDGLLGIPTLHIQTLEDVEAIADRFSSAQVHININFVDPLVAGLPEVVDKPAKVIPPFSDYHDHGEIELDLSKNTIVVAGDEAWDVEELADVPTIAEPTTISPLWPIHSLGAAIFLQEKVRINGTMVYPKPEQIVVVGHPTLHRHVFQLMADPQIDYYVLTRTETITNPLGREVTVGSRVKTTGKPSKEWKNICAALSHQGAEAVRSVVVGKEHGFTGLHVAAAITDTLGTGDAFFVGASNPIRDVSFTGLPFYGTDTFSPRGAAGIDGSVSQAIGIAIATQAAHPEEPRAPRTIALLGDVTFLHDVGGLFFGPESPKPENLTIVVANDSGGGIFEILEVGEKEYRSSFEQAFGAKHRVSIKDIAKAYGVKYHCVKDVNGLLEQLHAAIEVPGFKIIEAKTTRNTRIAMHRALAAGVGF
ncbi:2-succinyl-5-enolpyruvyl-6-hydroxy-3-cyclohexene-1-carboxylate synthase [Corynebacterium kutscheri]|uniref:2-succinyl-5-enolpyruvyl-6-hydroxy-3- cyclohexene-1-carboxylic-acid synthase n=1 Tax=Corynebacterium kutscheri TaxID=35755 RepID=UPI000F6C1B82|nr:2-succinyl-5-enolpyruvyl-6-hydroxy-3-cyclohexene-1-carboxylic-acid synthase [Corynebacterium kutscheri]VEH80625.1 2-succinyl-5-enolpyruvyl-6-hydroxy-3-cyclohexene-1-carboxylate synthase [Corynebacterium kutscheri]